MVLRRQRRWWTRDRQQGEFGSAAYARFAAADVSQKGQLERRAVGAIAEFMAALPPPAPPGT
jgi:hypothetical protein